MAEKDIIMKASENFAKILSSLGDYIINMGEIEKDNPEFRDFINKMKHEPEYFDSLMEKLPPELTKDILTLFIKMINLQSQAKEVDKLTPEEKIRLGKELKGLSNTFTETYKKISKIELKK